MIQTLFKPNLSKKEQGLKFLTISFSRLIFDKKYYKNVCSHLICSPLWEKKACLFLKRQLCQIHSFSDSVSFPKPVLKILSVCAAQASRNAFVWYFSPPYRARFRQGADFFRHKKLKSFSDLLLFYACFESLYALYFLRKSYLKTNDWNQKNLIQREIKNKIREKQLRSTIGVLTSFCEDPISISVKNHYETHPYPMWEQLILTARPLIIQPRSILIAGCGTGEYALQAAKRYPQAEVLAIDISLTSLAYAKRQNEKFHLKNIQWKQADILKMPITYAGKFDLIESMGVLQHLADPQAGLLKCAALLKPNGFLRLGLYITQARQLIHFIQQFYPFSASLSPPLFRKWRAQLIDLMSKEKWGSTLATWHDLYTFPESYDLLCHSYEQTFSVSQLGIYFKAAGLNFLQCEAPHSSQQFDLDFFSQQCHKNKDKNQIVHHLATCEQSHPEFFRPLGIFWCQK